MDDLLKNVFSTFRTMIVVVVSVTLLAGCAGYASYPAGTVKQINGRETTAVVGQESVTVSPQEKEAEPPRDYMVGRGDILCINISGKPEFVNAVAGDKGKGCRVDGSGNIQLPRIGIVRVGGLTVTEIQSKLQEAFKGYLKEPWVVVEIVEYKSQPLYLLGQFNSPGTYYMDHPYNLLQGISFGNGLAPTANLRGARLIRGKKIVPVDIYKLLHEGDQSQNIWLKAGDTLYIPDNSLQKVFVFGAVKAPGSVPMKNGQLTLHQAIAAAGLGDAGYDKNVRIVRSLSPTTGQLIVVDFVKILNGEVPPFPLMEDDVVYVPKSAIFNWNQAISEILPTLQVFGAILNPFVQIKYLGQ